MLDLSDMKAKIAKHHDHWKRSLMKTLSYRIILIVLTFGISLETTHKVDQAIKITTANTVIATIVYYLHERFWSRVKWGRSK
jgi:uncharacterized membrane protein